jgi:Tfp pilus assembly protein PilF
MSRLKRIAIAWVGQFSKLSHRHRPIATVHLAWVGQFSKLSHLAFAALLVFIACERNTGLPKPDSQEYRDLVTAFYVGLAGLQTGEDIRAKEKLTRATEIAPGEPAAWANLGLLAVRQQEFDTAFEKVEKARSLAPDNSQIEALLGLIESRRGKLPEATAHLKRAVDLDPKNLRALYALAQETERQGAENSDAEAQALFQKILESQPENLAVLLDVTRLASKRGDAETLKTTVAKLSEKSPSWPEEAKQKMTALQQAASGDNPRSAAQQVAVLRNVLARVPDYRQSLNAVKTPAEFVGEPFTRFIKLPSPSSEPAPADTATTFDAQPIPGAPAGAWNWIGSIAFNDEGKPALVVADGGGIRITGGANINLPRENKNFVLPMDFNYDFKTDLLAESNNGLRFLRQESLNAFTDVTARTGLSEQVLKRGYVSAAAMDFDLDGDLDVWLSPDALKVDTSTTPIVLRNKGDGTFDVAEPFKIVYGDKDGFNGKAGAPTVVWQSNLVSADIDGDGDPDAAMVGDSYDQPGWRLRVFSNERLGQYRERQAPEEIGNVRAVNAADLNGDGKMDFVALGLTGKIFRLSDKDDGKAWDVKEIATLKDRDGNTRISTSRQRLLVADLDNNGALDLIVESTESVWQNDNTQEGNRPNLQIFLNEGKEKFTALPALRGTGKVSLVDTNGDGRLELIGIAAPPGFAESGSIEGQAVQLVNRGAKNYHYQTIRTRAAKSTGDQRINSFGVGGEIEIRSGLLTQKQVITSPILHFGLGENTQTDVARIVWPNGSVQAEFELKADQSVLAEQRLKGSCPMLFAWDGNQISYVKDTAPWSPALGLRINAQVVAGIYQTEEWFKIPGDKIAPRDGFYDLRVTAELWEVYYIDHYSLMAVDHPQGTAIFTDERFAVPPPPLKIYATSPPKAFAGAKDDLGQDVSNVVRDLDQKYLGTFGKGRYQGITRDHWVELELPADAPPDKRLYLIGDGFVHPTDGSINVAYGQTSYPPPKGLSIETPDARGNWATAKSGLGFPAGKLKTVVLDLDNIFRPGAPRKLRLRTSMEIYWDRLEWAEALPDATFKTQRINLSSAELRYRGFSKFSQADDSSPELPDYNRFEGTAQKWRDLIGYCTRHGDVRELLEKIDDRMVITNAGDELRLKFAASPAPPAGWTRDYVMIGDGWIKDGDLNSTFSKTVLPLPYHGLKDYNTPPGRLEDDPAYKLHPQDWQNYHTRYITPEFFLKALRD